MCLRFQTELTVDESVAHTMVEVAVGTEQVEGVQAIVADIQGDGSAFFLIHHAAVDDDSLMALVAHHIAVLGEYVKGKTLNGNHIGRYITYFCSLNQGSAKKLLISVVCAIL